MPLGTHRATGGALRPFPLGANNLAIQRVQDRYQKLERIGEGSCGVVFRCRDTLDGSIVAVKKVHFTYEGDAKRCFGIPPEVLREISILRTLGPHANVVGLREALVEKDRIFLVCEYVDRDLRCHLNLGGPLQPMRIKLYMWQILRGLTHCHSNRIAHRDLKPQNLLVDIKSDTVKLCDFSLSRYILSPTAPQTRRVASLWYRSPELLLGGEADGMRLDCWSTGCVFAELLLHTPLFPGCSEIETIFLHFRLVGTPDQNSWPELKDMPHWSDKFPVFRPPEEGPVPGISADAKSLLTSFLRCNPNERLLAYRAIVHNYFLDLDTSQFSNADLPGDESSYAEHFRLQARPRPPCNTADAKRSKRTPARGRM